VLDPFHKLNEEGQTIVMVTHELGYTQTTHRMIELRDGEIVGDRMLG